MTDTREISVTVNGVTRRKVVDTRQTLGDFLRHELDLRGTHLGCEHGVCGACTILLDGMSTRSCLTLAVQADGHHVTTVESLADGKTLHPLQEAFRDYHALQCGFCTPGILMSLVELLAMNANPNEDDVARTCCPDICVVAPVIKILSMRVSRSRAIRSRQEKITEALIGPVSANGPCE